mgnify:CR=1 FL=1
MVFSSHFNVETFKNVPLVLRTMKVLAELKRFLSECLRVLKITRKPTGEEFKTIVKVSGLGIALIGMLGFVLQVGKQLLPK